MSLPRSGVTVDMLAKKDHQASDIPCELVGSTKREYETAARGLPQ